MNGLSLDDLRNLPEALEVPARPVSEQGLKGLYALPLSVIDARTVAARAFSRLVSVCTTCGGTGWRPHHEDGEQRGSDCVDGLVVSPEAEGRFKSALYGDGKSEMEALRDALGIGGTG